MKNAANALSLLFIVLAVAICSAECADSELSATPRWWQKQIAELAMQGSPIGDNDVPALVKSQELGALIPKTWQVRRDGDNTIITLDEGLKATFPVNVVEQFETLLGKRIAVAADDKRSYVAVYTGAGFPFELYCFSEGKERWKMKIAGLDRTSAMGRPWHFVELRTFKGQIQVFSADTDGAFACGIGEEADKPAIIWRSMTERILEFSDEKAK